MGPLLWVFGRSKRSLGQQEQDTRPRCSGSSDYNGSSGLKIFLTWFRKGPRY